MKVFLRSVIALLVFTCNTVLSQAQVSHDIDWYEDTRVEMESTEDTIILTFEEGSRVLTVQNETPELISVSHDISNIITITNLHNSYGQAGILVNGLTPSDDQRYPVVRIDINSPAVFDSNTDSYYQVIGSPLEFEDAKQDAASRSYSDDNDIVYTGRLAVVNSAEKQSFIEQHLLLPDSKLWIGALRNTEDVFEWITGETLSYENWNDNEPSNNNGNENGIEMYGTGLWNDLPSTGHKRSYLVEFKQPPVIATPFNDIVVNEDDPDTVIDLNTVFNGYGELLTYTANSSNELYVGTRIIESDLVLSFVPDQNGISTISITATNSFGDSVSGSFSVTVNPVEDTPIVISPISNQSSDIENQIVIDLNSVFNDPDVVTNNDSLQFSAISHDETLLSAVVNENLLTLTVLRNTSTNVNVEVTATDLAGLTVTDEFTLHIQNKPFSSRKHIDIGIDQSLSYGDIDRDGDFDLVSAGNQVQWFENSGGANPTFTQHSIASGSGNDVEVFDMDNDGDPDVLAAQGSLVEWYENDGTGQFVATHFIANIFAYDTVPVDLDRDGDVDIVTTNYQNIKWYENVNNNSYTEHTVSDNSSSSVVKVADINNDGYLDIIPDVFIDIFVNNGNQSFTRFNVDSQEHLPNFQFYSNANDMLVADLDYDGDQDIVQVNDLSIYYFENIGDSDHIEFKNDYLAIYDPLNGVFSVMANTVFTSDLNSNGLIEILTSTWVIGDPIYRYTSTININEIDENNGHIDEIQDIIETYATSLLAIDLDGDGDQDLITLDGWYENYINIPIPIRSTVSSPIADYTVLEDADDRVIDLDQVFDHYGHEVSYSFTNDNPVLLEITLEDHLLRIDYLDNRFGTSLVTIDATDDKGFVTSETFKVKVEHEFDPVLNPENGHYYELMPSPLTWFDASVNAANSNFIIGNIEVPGHLVTINSVEEQQFINTQLLLQNEEVWIGGIRNEQQEFEWITDEPFEGLNWRDGEPNGVDNGEHNILLNDTGEWNDAPGHIQRMFIVEFEPNETAPEIIITIEDILVNEDAADTVIDIRNVFDGKGDVLSIAFTNSNESLLAASLVENILTLSYIPDQYGSAEISITATNSADESITDTFLVTVNPVNDAPSFVLGVLPHSTLIDSGQQQIEGVVLDLKAGPVNEQDQQLTINVTNDNAGFFAVQPQIDSSGTLTYTPAEGASGTAIVSVTLMDDGGTENDGVNTSETLTFPITIESANAVLRLIDSNGNGIAGASAQYHSDGAWLDGPGTTDVDGRLILGITLSGKVKFRMTYEGSNQTITQDIDAKRNVTFQTVNTTVELVDSNGAYITDENGVIEFNRNGWQPFGTTESGIVSREMLQGSYNFRMTYANGSISISQNIADNPIVTFETVPVTVALVDSTDSPINSSSEVMFRGSEWVSMGTLDSGSMTKELLPASYRFRVTHASATVEKRSNVKFEPTITFKTKNVSIELRNSAGELITDGTARIEYNSNGWNDLGITDTGILSVELLPKTYNFRIEHLSTVKTKSQNVQFSSTVAFQTIKFDLELRNSESNYITEDNGFVQFNSGGWNQVGDTVDGAVSVELLPNLYNFRMTYANASVDQKNDYFQSTVAFQTENIAIELRDSMDELFVDAVGSVEFNSGGWQPMGDLVNGVVRKELLPKVYSFRMNYANAWNDKKNDGDDPLLVSFNTNNVLVQLIDSSGYLLEDVFSVDYNSGGWHSLGSSNTGQASMELLPKTYNFRLEYNGNKETQKIDVIDPETIVDFFTGQVLSISDSVVEVNSGGWIPFTQNMELLSGNYKFKYADNSKPTYTIEAGFINKIE